MHAIAQFMGATTEAIGLLQQAQNEVTANQQNADVKAIRRDLDTVLILLARAYQATDSS